MLHRAYAELGAQGMNYTAVDQPVEKTRSRIEGGACFVAVAGSGELIGTIKLSPSDPEDTLLALRAPDVAGISQFGVDPAWRGAGVGKALHDAAEAEARAWSVRALILDTAIPATHLIALYKKWGYRIIARHQWVGKTYESVVMRKELT